MKHDPLDPAFSGWSDANNRQTIHPAVECPIGPRFDLHSVVFQSLLIGCCIFPGNRHQYHQTLSGFHRLAFLL